MTNRPKKATPARKPHNIRKEQYESFDELLAKIASEPRQATIGGRQVTITRLEGLLRVMVDRALNGNVREIIKLLQIMASDPGVAATVRPQVVYYMSKAVANL